MSTTTLTCDQAIFTSVRTPMGEGYRIIAASRGLRPDEKQAITRNSPSHDGLCTPPPSGDAAEEPSAGAAFYPLSSGRLCVALSWLAGAEHTGRGGQRVYTHNVVFDEQDFALCGYNAFNVLRAMVVAEEVTSPQLKPPPVLPELQLAVVDSPSPDQHPTLHPSLTSPWRCRVLHGLLDDQRLIVNLEDAWLESAETFLLGLPGPLRARVSFDAGLRFSVGRRHNLHLLHDHTGLTKTRIVGQPVTYLDPRAGDGQARSGTASPNRDHPSRDREGAVPNPTRPLRRRRLASNGVKDKGAVGRDDEATRQRGKKTVRQGANLPGQPVPGAGPQVGRSSTCPMPPSPAKAPASDSAAWMLFVDRHWDRGDTATLARRTSRPFPNTDADGRNRIGQLYNDIDDIPTTGPIELLAQTGTLLRRQADGIEQEIANEFLTKAQRTMRGKFAGAGWEEVRQYWPPLVNLWRTSERGADFAQPLLHEALRAGLRTDPIAAAETALEVAGPAPPGADEQAHRAMLDEVLNQLAIRIGEDHRLQNTGSRDRPGFAGPAVAGQIDHSDHSTELPRLQRLCNRWKQVRPQCPLVDQIRNRCTPQVNRL